MSTYHVVKLLTNHLYPTYQLHAFMASKKTSPQDGLRIAALTTLEWLRLRLGDHAPSEIQSLPEPADYRKADSSLLKSFYLNRGFVVNVLSLPEQGIWSLQISEPDLGSEPGNPNQSRKPISGRVLETNVAYKIVGDSLECGFQTVVSDPDADIPPAPVYRLAIIRQLLKNPDFGLRQVVNLKHEYERITTDRQLKQLWELTKSEENQLPCILFTQIRKLPEPRKPGTFSPEFDKLMELLSPVPQADEDSFEDPPYSIEKFARSGVTFCRTFLIEGSLLKRAGELFRRELKPGDILALEPASQGGNQEVIGFRMSKTCRKEAMDHLSEKYYSYCRGREYSFGHIEFLSSARNQLLRSVEEAKEQAGSLPEAFARELEEINAKWQDELQKKEEEIEDLRSKLERHRCYQARLGKEKEALRTDFKKKEAKLNAHLADKEQEIRYYQRKLQQPKAHDEIAAWVRRYFGGRLELHPKAEGLLQKESARKTDVGLICDALDYLATDYWEYHYHLIDKDQMYARCSLKYGRPFEVTHVGNMTIEYTPGEYKIKYSMGGKLPRKEHSLDCHLKVGNDAENLLRIYFLHDDIRKKIIVGSLPCHLTNVKYG